MMPGFLRHNLADWIVGLLLLAMIYLLVKPDSVAADFITAFSGALTALVGATIGATGDASGDTGTD